MTSSVIKGLQDAKPFQAPSNNKGFQIMRKHGWNDMKGLGPQQTGRVQPVPTVLKRNRTGVGLESAAAEVATAGSLRAPRNWDSATDIKDRLGTTSGARKARVAGAAAIAMRPRVTHFKANDAAAVADYRNLKGPKQQIGTGNTFGRNQRVQAGPGKKQNATALARQNDRAIRGMLSDVQYPSPGT